jgi:hypothetical protein
VARVFPRTRTMADTAARPQHQRNRVARCRDLSRRRRTRCRECPPGVADRPPGRTRTRCGVARQGPVVLPGAPAAWKPAGRCRPGASGLLIVGPIRAPATTSKTVGNSLARSPTARKLLPPAGTANTAIVSTDARPMPDPLRETPIHQTVEHLHQRRHHIKPSHLLASRSSACNTLTTVASWPGDSSVSARIISDRGHCPNWTRAARQTCNIEDQLLCIWPIVGLDKGAPTPEEIGALCVGRERRHDRWSTAVRMVLPYLSYSMVPMCPPGGGLDFFTVRVEVARSRFRWSSPTRTQQRRRWSEPRPARAGDGGVGAVEPDGGV